jgi:site-specific DNA-methyltransferase (adenine-specific)
MSILLHGDCLDEMKELDDNSIDLIFCDLPYGQTSCKWDCKIDLELFWNEIIRIKKINTPIFFTTTTKFGVDLIISAPKKCPFRYDIVWAKSCPAGFLQAKRMPMRKHEMVYVFYEKLPMYDISSHQHKFVKERDSSQKNGKVYEGKGSKKLMEGKYDPPLPTSVVNEKYTYDQDISKDLYKTNIRKEYRTGKDVGKSTIYEPPLPHSLLEIKSTRGKHNTEKPVALMEWILKYYSKEGDIVFDPTMGSGSTGVACKNMNRKFIGIEKDPEIFEIAVNRIEE